MGHQVKGLLVINTGIAQVYQSRATALSAGSFVLPDAHGVTLWLRSRLYELRRRT